MSVARDVGAYGSFDVRRARRDFPILNQTIHGKPLIYLDNAATTQKPRIVLETLMRYYETGNANVHRGVHLLGDRATSAYEAARLTVQRFVNAREAREIIFTRGATEAINLVSQTYGLQNIGPDDEIVITAMEHHANIVPWHMLCKAVGAGLSVVPITDEGDLRLDEFEALLSPRVKLVAVTHVSNVLGTVNPVKTIIELAHQRNIPVLIDGAQAISHLRVDVQDLDCDFYAFSGHKVYGPMGIGVLYGKADRLEAMPPWQGGGDMIESVAFSEITYNTIPNKFEAGTPNVAGAVGLAAAIEYLDGLGREAVAAHEANLLEKAVSALKAVPGLRLLSAPKHQAGAVSFVIDDPPLSALDVGAKLDLEGIAVRTGHHCCQPLMSRLGVPGTVRASFGLYNVAEEVDQLATVLERIASEGRATFALQSAPERKNDHPVVHYPEATAPSVDQAAELIVEEFDGLDEWSDRYLVLVELGEKLPFMPAELKTAANRVHGCQSIVYLDVRAQPGHPDVIEFLADSDSNLVRGLIALLQHVFSGQRAADVLAFDISGLFSQIGLDKNLTTGRRNGLAGMVRRVRDFAGHVCEREGELAGTSVHRGRDEVARVS